MGAVCVRDEAQFVDRGDECAYETEVDEGDEPGVFFRPVVAEERADGPHGAQHGGYEEHQDVVGRQLVIVCVDVHEPG